MAIEFQAQSSENRPRFTKVGLLNLTPSRVYKTDPGPAPQGFLGHLIAREYSQEGCRDGEARSGFGGGGGSPEGDRRGRRAGPWGPVFGRAQARSGAASVARGGSRVGVAGQAGLKSRTPDARDEDHRRLQAKIGELLMETELLYAKVDQLEAGVPLARRRSTR